MFTGIVLGQGVVEAVSPTEAGRRLVVTLPAGWERAVHAGDSIAVDGCCLTVAGTPDAGVTFDVIHQTLRLTTLGDLTSGDSVNLEPAALPTTALGGHFVQGHIDGVARVVAVSTEGGEYRLRVRVPEEQRFCVIERGSVTLAGVSLTVAALDGDDIEVALIPVTLTETTLGTLRAGDGVNLETDYLAKIVVNYVARAAGTSG